MGRNTRGPLRRLGRAALPLVVWLVTGCAGPQAPIQHFYKLQLAAPARGEKIYSENLEVELFHCDALTRGRMMLFRKSVDSAEVQRYEYHLWSDPPPRMLQQQAVAYLTAAGVAEQVVTAAASVRPEIQLTGELLHFEQVVLEDSVHVLVELQVLVTTAQRDVIELNETYREMIAAADASMESTVQAFNIASTRVFDRLVADLRK